MEQEISTVVITIALFCNCVPAFVLCLVNNDCFLVFYWFTEVFGNP